MASRIDMMGVALVGAGTLFAYAGITGKSALGTLYSVVSGKSPKSLAKTEPIIGQDSGTGSILSTINAGAGSGSAIAAAAAKYVGHKYVYGGPSNPNGGWDCSSFVSYILGHDIGMNIPGGSWVSVTGNGASHGPTSETYATWSGATDVGRSAAAPGMLLCWSTHVGFVLDAQHMISAYDTASGTIVTGIDGAGPAHESLVVRKINGVNYG